MAMADSTIADSDFTSSDSEYAEIVVVLHGETAWNVEGRLQGDLDTELNEVGRQQATAVANRLSKESAISAVYSSDLKRAFEIAHIIASICGISQVIKDPDLRESHHGNLQGLASDEIEKLTSNTTQEGEENFDQLYLRCTSLLQRIGMKHKGERVVVVTHGAVVRALHKRAAPRETLEGKIVNASVYVFLLTGHEWRIKTWNDANHLRSTGYLETACGGMAMADSTIAYSDLTSSDTECAEIIIVRHGETAWNVEGRLQGHLDVELNEVGRRQATAVANRLSKESAISAVYSSDLKRAFETAHMIASSCGVSQVIKDPGLRERHFGYLQGLTSDDIEKLTPNTSRTDDIIPGGGESLDQLYLRCTSSLQNIGMKHKGERVVVVTHGGVVRAFHKLACPNEPLKGKIVNASISVLQLTGHEWRIKTWNDTNHLNKTGYLETAFGGDADSG